MPARGHSTAPRFDGNALNLRLYFDEVESLSIDTSLNEEGKIRHALCYASREDNELWSTLFEAEAQAPDYARFRDTVVKLYPGADDERKYMESDLQRLIDTQQQYGIESRAELRHYYREFRCISKFLIDKRHLSDIERNKMYMRGFDEKLRERVKGRLQVKFPDHYYDDPYEWQDFHECTHFLLAGTAAESSVGTVTQACVPAVFAVPPTFSTLPPATAIVKTEDTASILQDSLRWMENMFAGVIYQNAHGGAPAAYAPLQQYAAPPQQYAAWRSPRSLRPTATIRRSAATVCHPSPSVCCPADTAIFRPAATKLHCFRHPHLHGPVPRTKVPFQQVF
jgi:hypothetical protein